MRYVNDRRRKVQIGDEVWMTTQACTGEGIIVKVYQHTCSVRCGLDLYRGVKLEEIEFITKWMAR